MLRAYLGHDLGHDLSVLREGAFFKLGKALFGLQDVELGMVLDLLVRLATAMGSV